jgi:glyceraldehyde 3-phosphate dehydrogenase
VHGIFNAEVKATDSGISVDGKEVAISALTDPAKLPWKDLKVDIVIESTGFFTDRAGAQKHLDAGAKWVLISAPAKSHTVCMGVNRRS